MNLLSILLSETIFAPDGRVLDPDTMQPQDFDTGLNYPHTTYRKDRDLTIRSLPASGTQLHIHEGANGMAHFKHDVGEGPEKYSQINSYDAAMADAGSSGYVALSIAERIAKILMPHGLGGSDKVD